MLQSRLRQLVCSQDSRRVTAILECLPSAYSTLTAGSLKDRDTNVREQVEVDGPRE